MNELDELRREVASLKAARDDAWAAYREAVGVPPSEHQIRRLEKLAQALELAEARATVGRAEGWDARDKARPQYLGPNDGHYEDCMGYEDCHCASYPNPYRRASSG